MPEFILEIGNSVKRCSADGPKIVLGRDEDCDVVLENGSISRQHAQIEKVGEKWILRDMDSGNGLFVDGTKVRRVVLTRGSQFSLGNVVQVTFLVDDADDDDVLVSEDTDVVASPEANHEESRPQGPAMGGYTPIEFLGEGPRSLAFSYRKDGGGKVVCLRFQKNPGNSAELAQRIADWNEVDEPGVARLDLLKSSEGDDVIRERLAEPGTLSDLMKRSGRVNLDEALSIGRKVAEALDALHRAGVRVGRLRPEKIRWQESDGQVRISGPNGSPIDVLGTDDAQAESLYCLAPEILSAAEPSASSRRGDIYALGAVLYQLFTGVSVVEGKTVEAVVRSSSRGLSKTPADRRKGLPEGLSDLIMAALSKDPAQRPLTVSDIAESLQGMSAQVEARAPSRPMQASEKEVGQRQAKQPKSLRFRIISWSVTIVLLLLLNVIPYLLYRDKIGTFGSSDGDFVPIGSDESGFDPDDSRSPLERKVDQDVEKDRFDRALSHIESALGAGTIDKNQSVRLAQKVKTRRSTRIYQVTKKIEQLIERQKLARANSLLLTLEAIVGSSDDGYMRLKNQIDG